MVSFYGLEFHAHAHFMTQQPVRPGTNGIPPEILVALLLDIFLRINIPDRIVSGEDRPKEQIGFLQMNNHCVTISNINVIGHLPQGGASQAHDPRLLTPFPAKFYVLGRKLISRMKLDPLAQMESPGQTVGTLLVIPAYPSAQIDLCMRIHANELIVDQLVPEIISSRTIGGIKGFVFHGRHRYPELAPRLDGLCLRRRNDAESERNRKQDQTPCIRLWFRIAMIHDFPPFNHVREVYVI